MIPTDAPKKPRRPRGAARTPIDRSNMTHEEIRGLFGPITGGRDYPAHAQLADAIRSLIRQGRLQPGDPLPSVITVGRAYTFSHTTPYNAYQALQREGVLTVPERTSHPTRVASANYRTRIAEANFRQAVAGLAEANVQKAAAAMLLHETYEALPRRRTAPGPKSGATPAAA